MAPNLTGRLLVATTSMTDPNFDRTVVFVIEHSAEGALGVVVNRPLDLPVADALPEWTHLVADPPVLFAGGPVGPENALALRRHSPDPNDLIPGVSQVNLAAGPAAVDGEVRVYAGYSGWDHGQLEGELALDAWWVFDATADDIFAADHDAVWPSVVRRQGGEYRMLADFPKAPWLN